MQRRVAVFVDGENIGSAHAAEIHRIAAARGEIRISRVYGNLGKLNGWQEAAPFSTVHAGTGKNATDILLSLDALELALDGRFDTCVVASSDRDFSHLAVKLRERGLGVVGIGHAETPAHFQKKCAEFVVLPRPAPSVRAPEAVSPSAPRGHGLNKDICDIIKTEGTANGMTLQLLGSLMMSRHGIGRGNYAGKNLRPHLEGHEDLFDLDPPGAEASVRLRR